MTAFSQGLELMADMPCASSIQVILKHLKFSLVKMVHFLSLLSYLLLACRITVDAFTFSNLTSDNQTKPLISFTNLPFRFSTPVPFATQAAVPVKPSVVVVLPGRVGSGLQRGHGVSTLLAALPGEETTFRH